MGNRYGILSTACACAVLVMVASASSAAQLGVQWLEFELNDARLDKTPGTVSSADTDADLAWGDLDKNGWTDLVVGRKEHGSGLSPRSNILLLNEGGVLYDRTVEFATASDVVGDLGFRTPTLDRDVEVVDLNGDGWLDVLTVTSLADGAPKELSHPRIYVNLQQDAGGDWLGLRYEAARIPQLLTKAGLAVAPRFCDAAVGDVTGDGAPDIYFVDYDDTQDPTNPEPPLWDLNDRLLVNDGLGYFTDESFVRMTDVQRWSAFGTTTDMADLNLDGVLDIGKSTSEELPYQVRAVYNDAGDEGMFVDTGVQIVAPFGQPYGMAFGDLNNDGREDVVVADDFNDYTKFNTATDAAGEVIWSPQTDLTYAGASDDGFGHRVHIVDLDDDGWNDVMITDVDATVAGCERRLHIYHNQAGIPGDPVVIREEAETTIAAGWKGAVGLLPNDLRGTYDVAAFDIDNDTDLDLVIARCEGTYVWESLLVHDVVCQTDLGFAGPGSMTLSLCGDDLTLPGSTATLSLSGAAPSETVYLPVGLVNNPTPFKSGLLAPTPALVIVDFLSTDALGELQVTVPGGHNGSVQLYMQAVVQNGGVYEISNALGVLLGF